MTFELCRGGVLLARSRRTTPPRGRRGGVSRHGSGWAARGAARRGAAQAMFVHKGHGGLRLFAGRAYAALGAGALGDVGSEENFGGSKDGADADY